MFKRRLKQILRECGHALNLTVHERIDRLEDRFESATLPDTQAALLQAAIQNSVLLRRLVARSEAGNSLDGADPVTGLSAFLTAAFPGLEIADTHRSPKIGANEETASVLVCAFGPDAYKPPLRVIEDAGYQWQLFLQNSGDGGAMSFEASSGLREPSSPGLAFLFRDPEHFCEAVRWCTTATRHIADRVQSASPGSQS